MYKEGDRIEMVSMPDDPHPIPAGTQGTIDLVNPVGEGRDSFLQLGVKWDNGRTLLVCIPPDTIRKL